MTNVEHTKLIRSASYVSVITASIIAFSKTYGWFATESQSILACLIDSMLDVSSSLINLVAIRFALQPPDYNHRFGHEKFQDLAIFSQAMFFIASSLFTMTSSVKAIVNKSELRNGEAGINVMYFCILITCFLVAYQTYVVSKTKSAIISVDKLHYFTDLLTNIVVVISIHLSAYFYFIDPLFGIAISIYVAYAAYGLFRKAIRNLVDEEFSEEERQKILSVISNYKQIKGVHELKTRYAANKPFIQFHLEMDGAMSLEKAHLISDEICGALLVVFPGGEITIHQDPEGVEHEVNYREKI